MRDSLLTASMVAAAFCAACGNDSSGTDTGSGGAGGAAVAASTVGSGSGGSDPSSGSGTAGTGGDGGSTSTGGSAGTAGAPPDAAPDAVTSSDAAASDLGIFGTAGTEALALTEAVNATNGSSSATVQASFTNGGTMLRSMTLAITANGAIGPGTFSCGGGMAGVIWQPKLGVAYTAGEMMGSCTIIATSVGKAVGEVTEGTFEATVASMGDGGPPIMITNGTFKAKVK